MQSNDVIMYADTVSSKTIEEVLHYMEAHGVDSLEVFHRATESSLLKINRPNNNPDDMQDSFLIVQEKIEALGDITLNAEKTEAAMHIAFDELLTHVSDETRDAVEKHPYLFTMMKLGAITTQVSFFVPSEIINSVLEKCLTELIDLGSYQQQISAPHSNE